MPAALRPVSADQHFYAHMIDLLEQQNELMRQLVQAALAGRQGTAAPGGPDVEPAPPGPGGAEAAADAPTEVQLLEPATAAAEPASPSRSPRKATATRTATTTGRRRAANKERS